MDTFTTRLEAPLPRVEAWLGSPSAAERLQPPWRTDDPLEGRAHTWSLAARDGGTVLTDEVDGGGLERVFAFRHQRLSDDLARHLLTDEQWTVVVAGSSGFVGQRLCAFLRAGGHRVVRLVRREAKGPDQVCWEPSAGELDPAALSGATAVINLAGPSISDRWTPAYKQVIEQARVDVTRTLATALATLGEDIALVSASAVGFYGDGGERLLDEGAQAGEGFLARVGQAWEGAAVPARAAGLRVVRPRIGLVLEPGGGVLETLLPLYRKGLGGPAGSGRQWMPWVSADDVLGILHHLVRCPLQGPVNTVSPEPVRQKDFASTLGQVLGRPAFVPAPAFALRAMMGREQADELLLAGQRAVPSVLEDTGFTWHHPTLEPALRHLLGR